MSVVNDTLKMVSPALMAGVGSYMLVKFIDPSGAQVALQTPLGSLSTASACGLMSVSGKLLEEATRGVAEDYLPSMPEAIAQYVGSSEKVLLQGGVPAFVIAYQNDLPWMVGAKLGAISYMGASLGDYLNQQFIEPAFSL